MKESKKILLNGYSDQEKDQIIKSIKNTLNIDTIFVYSGYSTEKLKIKEIIESNNSYNSKFIPDQKKILMFINFTNNEIKKVLSNYPHSLKRPLFCVLTNNNREWDIEKLYNELFLENNEIKKKIDKFKSNTNK